MRDLKVQALGPNHIAQAYPLIQATLPEVPLEAWLAFARAIVGQRSQPHSGLLGVVSEQGYITGLSSYRVAYDLVHGRSLVADHFVAMDLFDRKSVVHTLANAIEALARERQCGAVHTSLQDSRNQSGRQSTAATLADRGHHVESVCLCKILTPAIGADGG
ncbi:MAG TPA: hypothetical protein VIK47_09050 [Kiloniellales bacterium]